MRLIAEGLCDQGMKRSDNQDAIVVCTDGSRGLFMVADGMGGHSDGQRASKELKKAGEAWWEAFLAREDQTDFMDTVDSLRNMLFLAGQRIWEETPEKQLCGSTAVVLWADRDRYALINVGDSRCYLIQKHLWKWKLRQMTVDDVWENQPDMTAGLTAEEIRGHANYGRLVRAVGVKEDLVSSAQTGLLAPGTMFALMSDGVYKYIGDGLLSSLKSCMKTDDLASCLEQMKKRIYENQAPDNLSCVLVKVVSKKDGK